MKWYALRDEQNRTRAYSTTPKDFGIIPQSWHVILLARKPDAKRMAFTVDREQKMKGEIRDQQNA